MIKQRGSIMPALLDRLYLEYCRARLAEMRQQLLIQADSREVPEANCDASHSDGADRNLPISSTERSFRRGPLGQM